MKIRIIGEIKNIDDKKRSALIRVTQESDNPLAHHFMAEFYEAVIKSMSEYDEDAFMKAMSNFIDKELDKELEYLERKLHNED